MLRVYQRQALDAIWARFADTEDPVNRVAIELATGLGKTIIGAAAADEWLDKAYVGQKALFLAHTDEIIQQTVQKIRLVTKDRWTVGVVKAGQNETNADIVVASVQTLATPERRRQIHDVGFMIIDECHHSVANTYREIMGHFGAYGWCPIGCECGEIGCAEEAPDTYGPRTPVLGLTATLSRSDGAGLGEVWQDLAFSRSTTWAQRHGYLVDLVPYTITVPELNALASDSRLDSMLVNSIAPERVVDAWKGKSRYTSTGPYPSTVLFAPGVASAREFAACFEDFGIKAAVIHGSMPATERRTVLEQYEAGIVTVLCNAMVLTEGWDAPRTKCVIVARPTKSVPLFVQMVGRGLRPWLSSDAPPREDQRCILLSVADAVNSLATVADLSDTPIEVTDGKSMLAMADEWDIGKGIEDKPQQWVGPIRVEQWDEIVQRSAKAWKYTRGGVPFLPTAKRGEGYVFIVGTDVWICEPNQVNRRGYQFRMVSTAPDLEFAMALAEDEAQERGGDIGRLIADKGRAWRKGVPSEELIQFAQRLGIDVAPILSSRSAGKAGKLSDLIDTVVASRTLDRIAERIKERA